MDLGFMGPNYSISTACATANYCFVAAANHIRKGDADIIIAGGSEAPIIPVGVGGFVACRYLDHDPPPTPHPPPSLFQNPLPPLPAGPEGRRGQACDDAELFTCGQVCDDLELFTGHL